MVSWIDGPLERITAGRWWRVFAEYAQDLLLLVTQPRCQAAAFRNLVTTIFHELIDPHTKRRPLLAETLGVVGKGAANANTITTCT